MIVGIKVEDEIIRDLERLDIEMYVRREHGYWASLRIEPDLISRIKEAQKDDNEIWTIVENLDKQVGGDFSTRNCTTTRYPISDCIGKRSTFRVSFLERFAEGLGNQA
nr:putative reverse transcriptase domain-containing protein [Tanacetum cinerariifolium]